MRLVIFLVAFLSSTFLPAQTPIDSEESVTIGGIRQFITLKGQDRSLPLLLFLHGGPGGSVMSYADKFTDRLQQHFVVIQWDQRETGKTRELNPSPVPLSLSVFQDDTKELIDTLLMRFQQKRLYLAGHSWGTVLGFHIARRYPDLLFALLAIGPMINQLESERISLQILRDLALQTGNQKETEELAKVRIPFETGEQLYYHRKWLLQFSGSRRNLAKSFVETWSSTWLHVFNEASMDNLTESLPSIDCPVYLFAGRKDYQTNSVITEKYYNLLQAPKKGLFWFERSAHSVPSSEPERLQQLIIGKVLPQTFTIQKAEAPISDH
jgi:pimeloyl-ACP methyl ester carboxylesterase